MQDRTLAQSLAQRLEVAGGDRNIQGETGIRETDLADPVPAGRGGCRREETGTWLGDWASGDGDHRGAATLSTALGLDQHGVEGQGPHWGRKSGVLQNHRTGGKRAGKDLNNHVAQFSFYASQKLKPGG